MTSVCAREGCSRVVPPFARRHGDLYCSRDCMQLACGLVTPDEYQEAVSHEVKTGAVRKTQREPYASGLGPQRLSQ